MYKQLFSIIFCFLTFASISFASEETIQMDLTDGLVAYYPFNGNANDESGNLNDGIVYNAVLSADRYGESDRTYSFDGDGDYIEVQHSDSFNFQDEISISFWIKRNEDQSLHFPAQYKSFVLYKPGSPTRNFILIQLYDVGNMRMNKGETGTCIGIENAFGGACNDVTGEASVVPLQVWTHYVFTIDAEGNTKLFENGTLVDEGFFSPPLPTTSDPLRIGMEYASNFSFNGLLDDIAIYNRVLTESEIQELKKCNGAITVHPTANAGPDQTVAEGKIVTLNGSNSSDPDDGIASYEWSQLSGPAVTLSDDTTVQPTFTTPDVGDNETVISFKLSVTDNGGLTSTDICTITVDGAPPTGTLQIDENNAYCTTQLVTLTISSQDAVFMCLSNDGQTFTNWETYASSKNWVLSDGDGQKTVYVKLKDLVGNTTVVNDSIILDSLSPNGTVNINDNADYVTVDIVTLNLDASDAVYMCFSNDGETYTDWEPYSETKSWSLSDGDGQKTVYVKFEDYAGNTSISSYEILLDTTPPGIPILVDLGTTNNNQPLLDWDVVGTTGYYELEYGLNADLTSADRVVEIGPSEYTMLTPLNDGTWYWRVRAIDDYGNVGDWSSIGSFKIETSGNCGTIISKPVLLSPANEATNVSLEPTLTTSAFNDEGNCSGHWKTHWKINDRSDEFEGATTFNYISMDHSQRNSGNSTQTKANLTSLEIPSLILEPGTTYYWKVQYHGDHGNRSEWSKVYSFTTQGDPQDQNGNGIPDDSEVDDDTDLNDDGISDSKQLGVITSVTTARGNKQVGIDAGEYEIVKVNVFDDTDISDEEGKPDQMPFGLVGYKFKVNHFGETVTIKIHLSEPAPENADWVIYDKLEGWLDYSAYVTFNDARDEVTIELKDGGYGDEDHTENKWIIDPSGAGVYRNSDSVSGCFIGAILK